MSSPGVGNDAGVDAGPDGTNPLPSGHGVTEPYYADATVTVWAGDCLDVLPTLPDNSVDAVCTDPPYNLSFMAKPWDAYEGREDAGFAYWLAGLIDGEGHFAVKRHSRGTHAPMFALKMRADEEGTLRMIQRKLGVGSVTREDREPNPTMRWAVQDKEGCKRLVDLLDKYPLRAKKQIDYWTWRDAVCEWIGRGKGNRWHGGADNSRMAGLRERLMTNRGYTDLPWSGHEFQDWCRLWAAECLRILKPGGHLLAFGGTRTWHRLTCAVEDAGFEIRDSIAWLYGSGFPKSRDVSKAIDAEAGAERVPLGIVKGAASTRTESLGPFAPEYEATAPATPEAAQWQGWGTALKPAYEPVVVARKPLVGTVAANVLRYGTGALNVDACRIGTSKDVPASPSPGGQNGIYSNVGAARDGTSGFDPNTGRWPANVCLDESQAAALDQMSGERGGGTGRSTRGGGSAGDWNPTDRTNGAGQTIRGDGQEVGYGDTGGASRFYFTAKAGSDERITHNGVSHPTVKPLALMRWLVRLVCPPGGTVLDLFAGSGTTVEAAILEGFRCIAVERGGPPGTDEHEYLPMIVQRINRRRDPIAYITAAGDDLGLFAEDAV